jgi:hypothetical protein
LLNSYLTFDLDRVTAEAGQAGFSKLRALLNSTWPSIDKQSGQQAVPDWVRILRNESQLLSDNPVGKYAQDYLAGNIEPIRELTQNLGIPANSWFWQELVLGAVRQATLGSDEQFRDQILMLIELAKSTPVYRDKAIAAILNRYFECANKLVHPELRDFVINASVWKNPKLKAAGIATAWNQVPEPVWRMVMGWVNERNLRDFFDILAARRHADHGRLKFWSQYMNQISWTRLVFGAETIWQKDHNAGIRALLESETGAYATLNEGGGKDLDAFLMQIGDYIFVEFSKTGNGAYGYRANQRAFQLHAKSYMGSTADLKAGYYARNRGIAKIFHTPGWEARTEHLLRELGIHPDQTSGRPEEHRGSLTVEQQAILKRVEGLAISTEHAKPDSGASGKGNAVQPEPPPSVQTQLARPMSVNALSSLTVEAVDQLVRPYGATVLAKGVGAARLLWVTDPKGDRELERKLQALGFKWSKTRQAWYWRQGR